MSSLWEDITRTIREGVDTVVEKTEELTKIGKIKVDIINIKRNIEKNFAEMGGKTYHLIVEEKKNQISKDKEIMELVECVKLLEKELEDKKKDLENVKKKTEGATSEEAEKETEVASEPPKVEPQAKESPKSRTTAKKKSNARKSKKSTGSTD
jgi:hypothetical protein